MIKLAIDFGSSVTKIYRADTNSGIVLAEPSCVAIAGEENVIKAIGKDAKNLIGRTAEYTRIIYPVYEGTIADRGLATEMLKGFLSRIGIKKHALRRAQILVNIPCGLQEKEIAEYAAVMEECGLNSVRFVEQPYLAALGGGAALSESDPVFCLDIGGGVANAAVASANGIIAGIAINIGGNNMDANIVARISESRNLLIGVLTAEKIKNEIGTLSPSALGGMIAEGSSTITRQPASANVQAGELTESIRVYIDKILEYAVSVLQYLPAEVAAAVNRNGMYLSGGVMKISYVAQYIGKVLGMPYQVSEEPQFTTVLGGGVLLRDKEFLNRFSKKCN